MAVERRFAAIARVPAGVEARRLGIAVSLGGIIPPLLSVASADLRNACLLFPLAQPSAGSHGLPSVCTQTTSGKSIFVLERIRMTFGICSSRES